MEVNVDQKSLIQSIDSELEDAFAAGVTQSGSFLPKLTGYDTIPTDLRPQGRQGIMSTFAALVKRMGLFRPTQSVLDYANGFGSQNFQDWPDAAFQSATATIFPATGEVVLRGLCYSPVSMPSGTLVATLPVGFRPFRGEIFVIAHNGGAGTLRILATGAILTEFVSSTNPISLSGIRFLPA